MAEPVPDAETFRRSRDRFSECRTFLYGRLENRPSFLLDGFYIHRLLSHSSSHARNTMTHSPAIRNSADRRAAPLRRGEGAPSPAVSRIILNSSLVSLLYMASRFYRKGKAFRGNPRFFIWHFF